MSGRKALLKKIVERGAEIVGDPTAWLGEMTVSSRHTVYRFHDGVCVAVHRQDTGSTSGDCIGMRMVGWLVDDDGTPKLSFEWVPGASAVLMRPSRSGDALALTSPTIQVRRDVLRSSQVRRNGPPSYHQAADSMTRIGVPRGR